LANVTGFVLKKEQTKLDYSIPCLAGQISITLFIMNELGAFFMQNYRAFTTVAHK